MARSTGSETTNRGGRPYRSPRLVDYGSVAKLTQGSNAGGNDGPVAGMMASACL
jgi:hypothetical protein